MHSRRQSKRYFLTLHIASLLLFCFRLAFENVHFFAVSSAMPELKDKAKRELTDLLLHSLTTLVRSVRELIKQREQAPAPQAGAEEEDKEALQV